MRSLCLPLAALFITGAPAPAAAQSAEALLQAAIVLEGRACPKVVAYKGITRTSSGSGLLAVACSDGRHHVVEMRPDLSLNYISSCSTFEITTNRRCF
ncbi:hypothetical protein [Roseibium sp.]|uniref:hypothetical protein n=1 Tax=Roseibium sp. TaxID=1936156 RepID=UPI003BAA2328